MEAPNHKKTKLLIILVAAAAVGGFLAGAAIMRASRFLATDDAYIDGRTHIVAFRVSGTVKTVYVQDNQAVKQGDLLVELDPADYELKVGDAAAALDAEKAKFIDAGAGINAAAANFDIQEINLKQAVLDKNRAEALFKEGVIAAERHEKVLTAYSMAAAQVTAAGEQSARAKATEDIEKSLVKQKGAALGTARLNLSYTKIYAPCDGYVTRKSVEIGNRAAEGQPLMAVIALNDIWITANYKETQLRKVKPGQSVSIKVDAYPSKHFTGRVESIMAGTGAAFSLFPPENALGNYVKVVQRVPVKITIDKNNGQNRILRIGMSCVTVINTKDE
jgi:membrane fusion protein (multidrug efflux system)